jgi:hypothetical protein
MMMFNRRLKIVATVCMAVAGAIAAGEHFARLSAQPDRTQSTDTPAPGIGQWIKGVVVEESGRPVAGARVSFLHSVAARSVMTKPDGTFAIAAETTSLRGVSLLARAEAGARQGIFRFDDKTALSKLERTLARIVLKPTQTVTVQVVDARRAPVEGAAVVLLDVDFPIAGGHTNSRGVATLDAPVDATTHWIFGYKPGVGFDYFENYPSSPADRSPLPE